LRLVSGCHGGRFLCGLANPAAELAALIAAVAGIVGEVEVVGIAEGDVVPDMALVVIPADKADGIAEVTAAGGPATRRFAVTVPGSVQRLCVAIGRRDTAPRDDAAMAAP